MARIALDVMGTDRGPAEIVAGAIMAAGAGHELVLIGDGEVIESELRATGADLAVVHAPDVVGMGENPAKAVRDKPHSSIMVAARLVAAGDADALVSAGSTGAAMTAASIVIGRMKGVQRPAIATPIPRATGVPTLVLDAGANLEVKPVHLVRFAVMGALVAEIVYGIDRPRVGLLNIGEEPAKGREVERSAFALLEKTPVNFVGNIEGGDIPGDVADVVVTDGFTGNVVLKTMEGTAGLVLALVSDAFGRHPGGSTGDMLRVVEEVRMLIDPELCAGGAYLLGTRAGVVIGHGSSSRNAVFNAVRLAAEGVKGGLAQRMERGLAHS
ncbi:MAG: phosphate acyltransferase PlsX [Acidimicrobiia bacterium]|nr:phosphate acyltransferase PlsX [Acidimicrobiia bacterium]